MLPCVSSLLTARFGVAVHQLSRVSAFSNRTRATHGTPAVRAGGGGHGGVECMVGLDPEAQHERDTALVACAVSARLEYRAADWEPYTRPSRSLVLVH